MRSEDVQRVRRVTGQYSHLQGLRMVPIGLVLLFHSVLYAGWAPGLAAFQPLPSLLAWGAALWLFLRIGTYYERTFGRVDAEPNMTFRAVSWLAVAALMAAFWADGQVDLPVSLSALALAALTAGYWRATGAFRKHYLVLAGLLGIVGLLPLTGVAVGTAEIIALIGAAYLAAGVLDHVLLVTTFRSIPEEER